MAEAGSTRSGETKRCCAPAAGRGAGALCRRRGRSAAARSGPSHRVAEAHRAALADPPDPRPRGRDARPARGAVRGPSGAPRRAFLGPRADRAADPRARQRAARCRSRQRPRPPGRGASLLEGARARAPAPTISVRAGPRRRRDGRRRGDGAGDRALAAASIASRSPTWAQVELPAELQHKLVWLVAAALRHYIVQHHGVGRGRRPDRGDRERACIAAYDEGATLEARAMRLARRLDAGRPARRRAARPLPVRRHAALVHRRPRRAAPRSIMPRPGRCSPIRAGAARRSCSAPPASSATAAAAILLLRQQPRPARFGRRGRCHRRPARIVRQPRRRLGARGAAAVAGRSRLSRQRRPPLDPRPSGRRGGMSARRSRSRGRRPGRCRGPADRRRSAARRAPRPGRRQRRRHARRAADRGARPARPAARHHHLARGDRRRWRARPRSVGPRRAARARRSRLPSPAGSARPAAIRRAAPARPSARPISCAPPPTGCGRRTIRCA